MTQLAHYYFSPAVRRGLASAITADASGPRVVIQVRAQVTASGGGEDKKDISQDVQLYGPGDILGFSAHAVVRTDPRHSILDFEPNYLVTIDFVDPDFPWRFSPLKAGADGRLTPWIALVVLEQTEFKVASDEKGVPKSITVTKGCLPDLKSAAMWAHTHLTGNDGVSVDPQAHGIALTDAEEKAPESVISRLICPRRLKPKTAYRAFVVPTFKQGCAAAGLTQMGSGESPLAPAWTADADATLPCYYSWQFNTGERGDFEYLVRLLQPRVLTGLGTRPIDCAEPGYGIPGVERTDAGAKGRTILDMEGALRSIDTQFSAWGKDQPPGKPTAFQQQLADQLLNKNARELAAAKSASNTGGSPVVPSVVPPIYGSWFAARQTVDPARTPTTWLDELNLDPRHRAVAALGTAVVQQHQEAFMASAWQQLGEIEKANAVLRHGQLGREASSALYKRLDGVPDGHLLRMAAPLHARVRGDKGDSTLATKLGSSRIPSAAIDPALRRMSGSAGPLRRAVQDASKGKTDLLERMKSGALVAAGPDPKRVGQLSLGALTASHAKAAGVAAPPAKPSSTAAPDASTQVHFLEQHITSSMLKVELSAAGALANHPATTNLTAVRDAACGALDALPKPAAKSSAATMQSAPADVDLGGAAKTLKKALDPQTTVRQHVLARLQIQLSDDEQKQRDRGDPLAPLLASPDFPQPMYEALRDMSQDLILPGVETVPENTVALLKTNRRFVESYMVGLNHAFTGELLWRGAPVGGRFTYFRQFWDVADALAGENPADEKAERLAREKLKDIKPLTSWGSSRLGENDNRTAGNHAEQLVLLVRGALLKKYPNTLVYAVPAAKLANGKRVPALPEFVPDKDVQKPLTPMFHGSLAPDLTFFGFNFTEEDARGGSRFPAGIFFVLEERLSEARFGLDEVEPGQTAGPMSTWDDLTWDHVGVTPGGYLDGAKPSSQPSDAAGLTWGQSSAVMGRILLQKPVRIAVHAERMLPGKPAQAQKTPPPKTGPAHKAVPAKQIQSKTAVSNTPHTPAAQATIAVQPSKVEQATPAQGPATQKPPPTPIKG